MTNTEFLNLMKKDLTRFAFKTKDDAVHKGESKELSEAIDWVRHPCSENMIKYAKEYKMTVPEFTEYAHRFKTFYEGK